MRLFKMGFVALMLVAVVVSGIASSASAAHFGNNRAVVTSMADPDVTGKAVVNYSEGQGTFNGTITVRNLEPNLMYTFTVSGMKVCDGFASSKGTFTCNAQGLTLGGFTTAEVRLGGPAGSIVASGLFERAGNCRDADQLGSQCVAPGRNKGD